MYPEIVDLGRPQFDVRPFSTMTINGNLVRRQAILSKR